MLYQSTGFISNTLPGLHLAACKDFAVRKKHKAHYSELSCCRVSRKCCVSAFGCAGTKHTVVSFLETERWLKHHTFFKFDNSLGHCGGFLNVGGGLANLHIWRWSTGTKRSEKAHLIQIRTVSQTQTGLDNGLLSVINVWIFLFCLCVMKDVICTLTLKAFWMPALRTFWASPAQLDVAFFPRKLGAVCLTVCFKSYTWNKTFPTVCRKFSLKSLDLVWRSS